MLLSGSSLIGLAIKASDGRMGTVSDVLFDDATWQVRWIVVHTGSWPSGRTALIHPSVFERVDSEKHEFLVRLTRAEVAASPDILLDEPVSRQIEYGDQHYPDWDPSSGNARLAAGFWGGMGVQVSRARLIEEKSMSRTPRKDGHAFEGDPHLRSVSVTIGNRVHAADGLLGHVHDILIDGSEWKILGISLETGRWWPCRRLTIAPSAVRDISWSSQSVTLNISRHQAHASPARDPGQAGH